MYSQSTPLPPPLHWLRFITTNLAQSEPASPRGMQTKSFPLKYSSSAHLGMCMRLTIRGNFCARRFFCVYRSSVRFQTPIVQMIKSLCWGYICCFSSQNQGLSTLLPFYGATAGVLTKYLSWYFFCYVHWVILNISTLAYVLCDLWIGK